MEIRQQIREALKSVLSGVPSLEDHIVFDVPRITDESETPWAYVWLGDEEISQNLSGKKTRALISYIDLIGRNTFEEMSALERIASEIERRLDINPTLMGLVGRILLSTLESSQEFENSFARLRMKFLITYWTAQATPAIAI